MVEIQEIVIKREGRVDAKGVKIHEREINGY